MDDPVDPPFSESTPLLTGNSNQNRSNSKPFSSDLMSQNNFVSFQCPDEPAYSSMQPHNRQWRAHTNSRSDESSLATLAVDKKMSVPRRTFCLFVLFDFLLTTILWLIEVGTSSSDKKSFFEILHQQMTNFELDTSLFDVVMAALGRFLFLVFTYGIMRIRHYWPVAISTAVSDAFLVVKIFFVFTHVGSMHHKPTGVSLDVSMTIVLILTDFILTWIEVWFVDFKVIPAEVKLAQRAAQTILQHSYQSAPSVDDTFQRRLTFATRSEIESGRFYSPRATPTPSEGGFTSVASMYYSMYGGGRPMQLPHQQQQLVEIGMDGLAKLWELFQEKEIWTVEKTLNNGDIVYSTDTPEYGKSFKIITTVNDRTPDVILREIILKPENMPAWNKTVADVKILQRIGEQTCVTLEVSAPAAMGLIASREFITVRRFEKRGDVYVSAGLSTDQCEDIVPKSNFVRGFNGPTGFFVYPCEEDSSSSTFVWILNTDLKGNLSRTLVNKNLTRTMIEFVTSMKRQLQVE